jgi:hypothetical protein
MDEPDDERRLTMDRPFGDDIVLLLDRLEPRAPVLRAAGVLLVERRLILAGMLALAELIAGQRNRPR